MSRSANANLDRLIKLTILFEQLRPQANTSQVWKAIAEAKIGLGQNR